MRRRILVAASLLWVATLSLKAQATLYGTYSVDGFLQSKIKLELSDDDALRFTTMRFYVDHSDESSDRYLYTKANTFSFSDPGIGLYRPRSLNSNDFSSEESQYCFARSKQSEHFIVFWEKEFGADPTKAPANYAFDPDDLLERAEKVYAVNTQQLGFSQPGSSITLDTYKTIMFVHYTTTWRATGSGVDFKCGTLDLNPAAAKTLSTTAHEIGHTFQYIVSCDLGYDHGWQYGFGENASGRCQWWESCAQWQAFKVYPERQFTESWESYTYRYSHLNLLHEEWRYYNFFVQDYWCQLHGQDFIGRLWRESVKPEDPVEAYQRITGTSQADFCRDMFDYACRAITWDIDALRETGKRRTDRFVTSFHDVEDDWLEVDSANCPQNYGFNIVRLEKPEVGTVVTAEFKGEAGAKGYRAYQVDKAGWRYGFVALKEDGTRVYGQMYDAPEGTAEFKAPEGITKLWFVVLGAPTEHFRHPWDMGTQGDKDVHTTASLSNDEQWPYRVRFSLGLR